MPNGENMKIEIDNQGGFSVSEQENEKELIIKKTVYPMSGYGNHYYDGIEFIAGTKKVRVSSFGGGNGWARRGNMYERWSNENIHYITIDEYKQIIEKIKEILAIQDEVDKEAELEEFVNKLLRQHL
jgi:hypothetical protein